MGFLTVVIAAIATFAFGAVWYMVLATPWQKATGITPDGGIDSRDKTPFLISIVALLLVAGMMRHIFALSGIETVDKGFVAGLGIGLFLVTPWLAQNHAFSGKSFRLTLIDGGFAIIGCTIMGSVLTLL